MRKRRRRPANQIIQKHHIYYDPPKVVYIRMTEHYVCTMLQRMKTPTKGFLIALKYYIKDNENIAISGKALREQLKGIETLKTLTGGKHESNKLVQSSKEGKLRK